MVRYIATTVGLFPLPDWAKDRLSTLKGHQRHDLITGDEPDAVVAAYDETRAALVESQLNAGLDAIVEGQGRWDDMLAHPLAVNDAVETRGLVRYFDNNNFYRDPVVVDVLAPTGDVAAELSAAADQTDAPLNAVLPGPYTLATLATDAHYHDEDEFLVAIAELLAGEIEAFPPVDVFLLEPALVTDPPTDDGRTTLRDAIDTVLDPCPGTAVVHTYWGAPDGATYSTLLETAIDGVGHDLVTAPEHSADLVREFGSLDTVALGVVDGQNTLVETPAAVRDRVNRFEAASSDRVETVYLTPNTELFYQPVSKFEAKLDALATAAAPGVTA